MADMESQGDVNRRRLEQGLSAPPTVPTERHSFFINCTPRDGEQPITWWADQIILGNGVMYSMLEGKGQRHAKLDQMKQITITAPAKD